MKSELTQDCISRRSAIDALTDYFSFINPIAFVDILSALPPAEPEVREIGYAECANAMLKMWMDNVLTDGEYNRIMDKLNKYWGKVNA